MTGMKITFLGTGTSVGVPVIGCDCKVCTSDDPRDQRKRCSIHVAASDGKQWLVDCGPDLREQCLRAKLHKLDAVLVSHAHSDHIMGFDDLRPFSWHRSDGLPIHALPQTLDALKSAFYYAFDDETRSRGYFHPASRPIVAPFLLGQTRVTALPVIHGNLETTGFLFETAEGKRIAYMSDVKTVPKTTRKLMQNLDVLVVDALRFTAHSTHMCVDEAIAFSSDLACPPTWFTHFTHDIHTTTLERELPSHITMAHDTMEIVV